MGRLKMLLPFCSKPNHPIMDVVEKLHGDIYKLLMPNTQAHLLPEAGAERNEAEASGSQVPGKGTGSPAPSPQIRT